MFRAPPYRASEATHVRYLKCGHTMVQVTFVCPTVLLAEDTHTSACLRMHAHAVIFNDQYSQEFVLYTYRCPGHVLYSFLSSLQGPHHCSHARNISFGFFMFMIPSVSQDRILTSHKMDTVTTRSNGFPAIKFAQNGSFLFKAPSAPFRVKRSV
jgi:hypothetical protein